MEEDMITQMAIKSALSGKPAFCKFLIADDMENAYQNGISAPKSAAKMLMGKDFRRGENISRVIKVKWQGSIILKNEVVYFGKTNNELRIRGFSHEFTLLGEENTGSLLVFVQKDADDYEAWVLDNSDKIDEFLGIFGMSPTDTNKMID